MLQQDEDLRREDIQLLASRDALAAFFARLGYDTNYRLTQSAAAMNITGDALTTNIRHIERIASQGGGFFEVYLFELASVTVAATQNIVRAFRNRPGDYLLVLTDDYERLDFVQVERYTQPLPPGADQLTLGIGTRPTAGVRPRVLTVQRRVPDPVALRVLRRFSFTESDTFAQYDKLISAYSVAEWSKPYFNNRALFSDYYLIERLAHDPADAAPMTLAYRELRTLYTDARETVANQPEAVMRVELLEPTLRILGFTVSPVEPASGNEISADYQLDIAGADTIGARPLALCLAYPWNRSLDGKTDSNSDPRRPDDNPGASVVTLLDSDEADWAIVTNGKLWRLYSAHAHSRATNYYEIDLEETLALTPEHRQEAFSYFWRLFRAAAFVPADYAVEGSVIVSKSVSSRRFSRTSRAASSSQRAVLAPYPPTWKTCPPGSATACSNRSSTARSRFSIACSSCSTPKAATCCLPARNEATTRTVWRRSKSRLPTKLGTSRIRFLHALFMPIANTAQSSMSACKHCSAPSIRATHRSMCRSITAASS